MSSLISPLILSFTLYSNLLSSIINNIIITIYHLFAIINLMKKIVDTVQSDGTLYTVGPPNHEWIHWEQATCPLHRVCPL